MGKAGESWTMFRLLSESTWRCIPATAAVLIALLENGKVVGWEVPLAARAAVLQEQLCRALFSSHLALWRLWKKKCVLEQKFLVRPASCRTRLCYHVASQQTPSVWSLIEKKFPGLSYVLF